MDSFFLAEMFKYLYLLFSEKNQLHFDIDEYIFTTEAHLLPVSLSTSQPPLSGQQHGEAQSVTNSCVMVRGAETDLPYGVCLNQLSSYVCYGQKS